jgi:sulfhydrogenase subunit beta (sulfur reductase)
VSEPECVTMDHVLGRGDRIVVDLEGLDAMIAALRSDRRRVLGPIIRDASIAHGEIGGVHDLPEGWGDEQDGGYYRLTRRSDGALFGFAAPSDSWKRQLFPPRSLTVRARRSSDGFDVGAPAPPAEPVAFLGVRSCDLHAIDIHDRVFLDGSVTDPEYSARRRDVFIVAVNCGHPSGTCFCASMDTGPSATSGFDLSLTELIDDARHEFLVEIGTLAGASLIGRVSSRAATAADLAAAERVIDGAASQMGRSLDRTAPRRAAAHLDHPRWEDVARRCLACANCTMVCPTCFCSATEDVTSIDGATAERWRRWESCFSLDFSYVHGGPVRSSVTSRYRQWLLHKLVTWEDQFGTSGCVGCGRCITWCPVGIDLTAEIEALALRWTEEPDADRP